MAIVVLPSAIGESVDTSYSLSDIRTNLALLYDLSDTTRYTTARLNAAINYAIEQAWPNLKDTAFYEYTTVADQRDYTLPDDFRELRHLWIENSWVSYTGTQDRPDQLGQDSFELVSDANVRKFRLKAVSVSAGATLRIEYLRKFAQLTLEADETTIPTSYLYPATMAYLLQTWELSNPRFDVEDVRTRIALLKDEASRARSDMRTTGKPILSPIRRRIGED